MRFGFNGFVGGLALFAVVAVLALGLYDDAWMAALIFGAATVAMSLYVGSEKAKEKAKKEANRHNFPPPEPPLAALWLAQDSSRVGIGDNWISDHPIALAAFVLILLGGIMTVVVMRKRARAKREATTPPERIGKRNYPPPPSS